MPANLLEAAPTATFPRTVFFTSFSESRSFPMLTQAYHDGTVERSLVTDTVNAPRQMRTFKFSVRVPAKTVKILRDFYEGQQGTLLPFSFYNPLELDPEWNPITVRFTSSWNETSGIGLTVISFEVAELL
jgi:hypothetical protein